MVSFKDMSFRESAGQSRAVIYPASSSNTQPTPQAADQVFELPPMRIGPQGLPSLSGCPPVLCRVWGCRHPMGQTTVSEEYHLEQDRLE